MTSDPSRRGVGAVLAAVAAAGAARADTPTPPPPPHLLYSRDVRQFGADPTGRADSTAAFQAASAAGPFVVGEGVYSLTGVVKIEAYCALSASAQIRGSATVTFKGGFSAPIAPVFGTGLTVIFNPAFAPEGHPEWWGAITDTPGFDCQPALSACVAACPVTRLQPADYWIARTWKLTTNWRAILGVGMNGKGGNPATRIVTADPGIDVIQMGPDEQPVHGEDFLQGVLLKDLTAARSVAPSSPPPDPNSGACGVRLQYVLQSYIDQIYSAENINGFYVKACIATYLNSTHAARTLAATGGGTGVDRYYGYVFDGTANIGMANGNASVYVDFFSSYCAHVANNAFVYTYGGFTDLFFNRGECSGHANGMLLNGATKSGRGGGAVDCHIHHVIMDQLSGDGILINSGANGTAVNISQCYAQNNSGAGLHVLNSQGAVTVTGCQFLGGRHATGLLAEGSSGVSSVNNIFYDMSPAMVWKNSSSCESAADTIHNPNTPGSAAGMVQMISSVRCVWRGKINGAAGALPTAVALSIDGGGGSPCDYNLIDCSGIDPACLGGGAVNKLVVGGGQVTKVGVTAGAPAGYSHNVAAGVMD